MSRKKDSFKKNRIVNRVSTRGNMIRKEPAQSDKVPRNNVCPCGSGKKYKHCCARGARSIIQRMVDYLSGKE